MNNFRQLAKSIDHGCRAEDAINSAVADRVEACLEAIFEDGTVVAALRNGTVVLRFEAPGIFRSRQFGLAQLLHDAEAFAFEEGGSGRLLRFQAKGLTILTDFLERIDKRIRRDNAAASNPRESLENHES